MFSWLQKILGRTADPTISKSLKKNKTNVMRLKKYEWVNRVMVSLASLAIILFFMPSPSSFNYQYELDKAWHYPPLYSSYKFYINMDDSTLMAKRDSISRVFEPYFKKDPLVVDTVKMMVKGAVENLIEKSNRFTQANVKTYAEELLQRIDTVYEHGVISEADMDMLNKYESRNIKLIVNNFAAPYDKSNILDLHSAYKTILRNPVQQEGHEAQVDTLREQFLFALNLNTIIRQNVTSEESRSDAELKAMIDSISPEIGFVREKEKIIDRGEIVTKEKIDKLDSYKREVEKRTVDELPISTILGRALIVFIILVILNTYLYIFRNDYFNNVRAYLMLFTLMVLFASASSILIEHHILPEFIIPFCMVPIIIRVFLDSRTAFVFHIATVLITSICLEDQYVFIVLQIIAGLVTVQTLREMTMRSQIISTMIVITLVMELTYLAFDFLKAEDLTKVATDNTTYYLILVGGLLLLFAYPLFWIMEKFFGFTSEVTLVELSNTNTPLLQKLMMEAPGTFQHSMQVGTLATEIARKIGANVQLVRTGALYHDIGKLTRPVFFTENQSDRNPHNRLPAVKSAEVIINHVTEGIKFAEHYNLPNVIKRFILTHHGKGKVKYFYITYKNEHPDEEIDESLFTYPGPNPSSKEEAILMMADSVEAASRSLEEYTEESISNLVDRIVDTQVQEGFFNESDIAFKDVMVAKTALKERLKTVYHTRISYPELKNENEQGQP